MSRRTLAGAAAPALGLAVAVAAVVPATAGQAPSRATIKAIDRSDFKPNRYLQVGFRWDRDVTNIRSGGTLTIRNRTSEGHSFSLVKKSDLPRTLAGMEACFSPTGVCGRLGVAHGAIDPTTGEEGEPTIPLVNVGPEGFDRPGDSIALAPRSTTRVKITAKKGARLYFLCAPHPWMQGKLVVK
jgi:hypothetical protein